MAQQIQHRRDEESEWIKWNPILADGEIGYVSGTSKYKIGDGVTHWNDLKYFGFSGTIEGLPGEPDGETESPDGEPVVRKSSLVAKFIEIDKDINNINTASELQAESIKTLTDTVGTASGDSKTGLVGDIDNINNILNADRTGITALNTKADKLDKEVFGAEDSPETGLTNRVKKLENTHVSISQEQYDELVRQHQLVEGTFYYIYEEAKQ